MHVILTILYIIYSLTLSFSLTHSISHSLSLYLSLPLSLSFSLSLSVRAHPYSYGSDEGNGANWHPPRGMHLLRGEAISWLYVMALYDAMLMIKTEQQSKTIKDMVSGMLCYGTGVFILFFIFCIFVEFDPSCHITKFHDFFIFIYYNILKNSYLHFYFLFLLLD